MPADRPIILRGVLGWGNRKGGLEAYGPGGRWEGEGHYAKDGDLLGDAAEVRALTARLDAIETAARVVLDEAKTYVGLSPAAADRLRALLDRAATADPTPHLDVDTGQTEDNRHDRWLDAIPDLHLHSTAVEVHSNLGPGARHLTLFHVKAVLAAVAALVREDTDQ